MEHLNGLDERSELAVQYDERYFASYVDRPYRWGEPTWHRFFDQIAEVIASVLAPQTVLDAGCAIGFLVEALRRRGVEASGIDISEYAIGQVPEELGPHCSVASLTEELQQSYDVIVCIEVLEHLSEDLAPVAVSNLTRHTESIVFSSTPTGFREPTHLNVQPTDYWVGLFARHGFFRNLDFDLGFISPQAIHFVRSGQTAASVAQAYERWHWRTLTELEELRAMRHQSHEATARVERAKAEAAALREELEKQQSAARSAKTALEALRQTRTFRYTARARKVYWRLRQSALARPGDAYTTWVRNFDTLNDSDRIGIRDHIQALPHRPLISVVMPVFNTPERWLVKAIESVRTQLYENWELCIADDASTLPYVRVRLAMYEHLDPRIKVVFRPERGHISAASNSALELCTGEYVALLDHDDELAEHALYLVAVEINRHPEAGLIYSDEDKIDASGRRFDPYFKPDWNPDLLRSQNCISHLGVYRTDVVRDLGGFRKGFEGSQDHDLALRVVEHLSDDCVRHIPFALYRWRTVPGSAAIDLSEKSYAVEAARRAIDEHLHRTGARAEVLPTVHGTFHRVRYSLPPRAPLVSLIVPTRDDSLLERCLESLQRRTSYPRYEILVVGGKSDHPRTARYLRSLEERARIRMLRQEQCSDTSASCNFAAEEARGELLCFLHNDIGVITPEWLKEMVSHALRSGIGAVGAKLLYPDGRIEHAGFVLGIGGLAGHAHRLLHAETAGHGGRAALIQNCSAVSGACLVVQRSVFEDVGGFDSLNLPTRFSDIDFCLRLVEAGYRNLWAPDAQLFHFEPAGPARPWEDAGEQALALAQAHYIKARWGSLLRNDPAYNPNLALDSEDFRLAWPPRTERPWRSGQSVKAKDSRRRRWSRVAPERDPDTSEAPALGSTT